MYKNKSRAIWCEKDCANSRYETRGPIVSENKNKIMGDIVLPISRNRVYMVTPLSNIDQKNKKIKISNRIK